jgi:hypothetical protein
VTERPSDNRSVGIAGAAGVATAGADAAGGVRGGASHSHHQAIAALPTTAAARRHPVSGRGMPATGAGQRRLHRG